MKALIWNLIAIICILAAIAGIFLLLNRPMGVAVNCEGSIEGLGSPSFPLTSYENGCTAEVEVYSNSSLVCSGSGDVIGEKSIITCPGLEKASSGNLSVRAMLYNDSGQYANLSRSFQVQ
jgi:hypothetical protein